MLFTNEKLDNFAKDPAVIKFNGIYYLYYTVHFFGQKKYGIGTAHSSDMENWVHDGIAPETTQ